MYFFMSHEVIIHERQLFTYLKFLSQLGGLMGIIIAIVKFIVNPIIFNFSLAKIIEIIYLKKKSKKGADKITR